MYQARLQIGLFLAADSSMDTWLNVLEKNEDGVPIELRVIDEPAKVVGD